MPAEEKYGPLPFNKPTAEDWRQMRLALDEALTLLYRWRTVWNGVDRMGSLDDDTQALLVRQGFVNRRSDLRSGSPNA